MTKRDFILSIIASLIATILFEIGRKLYPRLLEGATKVIALRFALIRGIVSNYYLLKTCGIELKNYWIEFFKATFQTIKATKNNLTRVVSLQSLGGMGYSKSFAGVLQSTVRSPYRMSLVMAIVIIQLLVLTFIWGRLHSWPNEQHQELTRELYQLNTALSYSARDWGRSLPVYDCVIEIKTSPDNEGKSALIRIPAKYFRNDVSTLDFNVDTSHDRCSASIRTKSVQEVAITSCTIIPPDGKSL